MTPDEAVKALDALTGDDPENAHGHADDILLALAGAEVQDAHARLVGRAAWWASA